MNTAIAKSTKKSQHYTPWDTKSCHDTRNFHTPISHSNVPWSHQNGGNGPRLIAAAGLPSRGHGISFGGSTSQIQVHFGQGACNVHLGVGRGTRAGPQLDHWNHLTFFKAGKPWEPRWPLRLILAFGVHGIHRHLCREAGRTMGLKTCSPKLRDCHVVPSSAPILGDMRLAVQVFHSILFWCSQPSPGRTSSANKPHHARQLPGNPPHHI